MTSDPVTSERFVRIAVVLGLLVIAAYLVGLAWAMQNASYDIWGGLLVAPMLVAVTVPLARRVARRESDPWMFKLILAALSLKLLASVARYAISYELYEGGTDASIYHEVGSRIAAAFRRGDFSVDYGLRGEGTQFIETVTGWVYTVTGPSKLAGFLIFSWLGFWGLYLFYRAFRVGFPEGDHRRYAVLVFFLPSLLFWPSSLGKEAWMTLTLGLTAYGVARLLVRQRGAFVLLAVGLWATAQVRPHVTLVVFASLLVAYLLRRSRRTSYLGPAAKAVGLAVLVVIGLLVVSRVETFFGIEKLNTGSAQDVIDDSGSRTEKGGSSFAAEPVRTPLEFPKAVLSVLFRPYPTEIGNAGSALASLEGMVLLVMCLRSASRLRGLPRELLRTPFVAFACVYTLLFIFAFASIANFGILARQRVQMFPMFLVLLCLPLRPPGRRGSPPSESRQWAAVTT